MSLRTDEGDGNEDVLSLLHVCLTSHTKQRYEITKFEML